MEKKKHMRLRETSMMVHMPLLLLASVFALVSTQINLLIGLAELLIVALYALILRNVMRRRRELLLHYVDEQVGTEAIGGSSSLLGLPIAVLAFRPDDKRILWATEGFWDMSGRENAVQCKYVQDVAPDFSDKWLSDGKNECSEVVTVGNRHYRVCGYLLHLPNEPVNKLIAMTYWVDMTDHEELRRRFAAKRPIVAILMIDNYDELMNAGTEASRSAILAQIDEKIGAWIQGAEAVLLRYTRNKYLLLLEEQRYDELAANRFSVLETVREVVTEDGVAATLSIGVGKDAETFHELYRYASLSIEMSLSRGGDQVVVRNKLDFEFYGGKTKSAEKRTKVKSRVMATALGELISDARQVFVMGHKHADMDALGAAVGIRAIARKRGKEAQIVIDRNSNACGEMIARLEELPEYKDAFISGSDAFMVAQSGVLLVVVDTNRPDFVESEQLLDTCNRVAVIDHHRRAASYIESAALNFHEPYASSASELVSELLQYLLEPGDLLRGEAEAMLAGIVLDTKNFTMRTGGRTFEAAAYLRRVGADTGEIQRFFQSNLAEMLTRCDIIHQAEMVHGTIAVAAIDETVDRVAAAKASDELLTLRDVEASIVLFRQGDGVNLSARSLGEINVQLLMEQLGGGGNATVAGGQVPDSTVAQVRESLLAAIEKYFAT